MKIVMLEDVFIIGLQQWIPLHWQKILILGNVKLQQYCVNYHRKFRELVLMAGIYLIHWNG
jgi:hypothetical protein